MLLSMVMIMTIRMMRMMRMMMIMMMRTKMMRRRMMYFPSCLRRPCSDFFSLTPGFVMFMSVITLEAS